MECVYSVGWRVKIIGTLFTVTHVILTALHWATQMMVKVRHADCLVKDPVVYIIIEGVIKGQNTADCVICLGAMGGIIPNNLHRSVVVLYNKGTCPKYGCIVMQVEF